MNFRNGAGAVLFTLLALLSGVMPFGSVAAAEISGTVSNGDGGALSGVMITAQGSHGAKSITRYSDSEGRFWIDDLSPGEIDVRVHRYGFREQKKTVRTGRSVAFVMSEASRETLLAQLPAHVWTERVSIEDPVHYQRFRIHCIGCHQQGLPATRWPKSQQQWATVFDRMAHKSALLTAESRRIIADALIEAYSLEEDETPRIPEPPTGEALKARITEWRFDSSASWLHDAKVGPDGVLYATDSTLGRVVWLDPATGEFNAHEFEDYDPNYRNFIGTSTKTYPHGLNVGPDGNVWVLLGLDRTISKFDPKAREEVRRYKLPFGSTFPHTGRFDSKGRLWFTLALSNQLGMFDPETESLEIIDLPTRTWGQWLAAGMAPTIVWLLTKFNFETTPDPEMMPLPYGVDIGPDGKVWVSQWNNKAIVSFDPDTDELKSYDTPFYGPRRLAVDSKGDVWAPAWGEGRIYRFRPSTKEFSGYELPPGPGSAAYTVDIHPKDDSVWVCGANSDRVMRFDPVAETFVVYPLPTRGTFCRDLDFDSQGNVWTNYSNFPTQHIGGGGLPALVRIQPDTD